MDATVLEGGSEGLLYTSAWHGARCRGHANPSTPWRGKEPEGMAVCFPVLTPELQGPRGQRSRAVLGACAAPHVHEHAGTVNSGNLQVGTFWQPETTGVTGRQAGPLSQQCAVCQKGPDFFDTAHNGALLLSWCAHKGEGRPLPLEGGCGEELHATECNGAGAS